MALELIPINEDFGAFASGIDISKEIREKAKIEIEEAMDKYAVLIWRNSALNDDQQLKFAGKFGNVEAVSYTHLTLPTNREV